MTVRQLTDTIDTGELIEWQALDILRSHEHRHNSSL